MTEDHTPTAWRAAMDVRVAFSRLRRRLREETAPDGITALQASVLTRLGKGEAATAAVLAQLEGVRPQSMATTVAALEDRGLVRRAPDPADRRRQILALTAEGAEIERGNGDARGEWLVRAIEEHLTEDEQRTLIAAAALLDRLARP